MRDDSIHRTLIRAETFFSTPPSKLEWSVRNLIEQGTFVVLGGEPKTSKTWAALEICLSVASGTDCFNHFEFSTFRNPKSVFMFLLEDNEDNVQARLTALGAAKGMSVDDLMKLPLWLRCRKPLSIAEQADEIIDVVNQHWRKEQPYPVQPNGLILIDPLRNAHSEDENDSTRMKAVFEACLRIRNATGYTLLINHHFKKLKSSEQESPGNAMRGTSSLYGAVDGIIGMRKIECNDRNTWNNNVACQVKAGPQAEPFGLALKVKDGNESGRATFAEWEVTSLFAG